MSALRHRQTSRDVRVTSALPPIADIRRMSWHVRFVPIADMHHGTRCAWHLDLSLAAASQWLSRVNRHEAGRC